VPIIGITGGIATGKTSLTHALRQLLEAEVFDSDACARDLIGADPEVQRALRHEFGQSIFSEEGSLDRAKLREIVFNDHNRRRVLEGILHPVIRAQWLALAVDFRNTNRWLLVDIPLLFERQAERHFDAIVVVACSAQVQRDRLTRVRKLDLSIAEKMIAAQLDLSVKIQKADHVIWNDSSMPHLDRQAALLASLFKQRHG
jgi:dephospho-CoA kinase